MNTQNQLSQYIITQLQTGLTPVDITNQLRSAGWKEDDIKSGFATAQSYIAPSMPAQIQQTQVSHQQLPAPIKRGRMKTGWLLLKQSLSIIKANPSLWKYMIISIIINFLVSIVVFVVIFFDLATGSEILVAETEDESYLTLVGFVVLLSVSYLLTVVTLFYATALTSHVLKIFSGQATTFSENVSTATKKLPAILTFALITLTVGVILRTIEERFKLVGLIVARLLGVIWALATSFVVPIIADSNSGGFGALKESGILFKKTWGETITSRVVLGGALYLIYFAVAIPILILLMFLLIPILGMTGMFIAIAVFIIPIIVLSMVEAIATNVLNVALYYYAKNGSIPPSFSPELLSSVFYDRKQKNTK